ncbi:hypothetical protein GCM10009841_06080 [Microlunatus panaciterrae]|uniref:CASP-like protein n=1 Tax=Microlunatus panaciterrae TaxID=400768 RepID=A0ABS2RIE8_9ACTN|nr:hypothetical protein [Microlunatus panaciterrae]MBM7798737.1 hypothetical protein [Microlunatus panaciterrae]
MSTSTSTRSSDLDHDNQRRRLTTETKNATKTTEFFAFVAMVLAVVITANLYDGNGTDGDPFGATTAMRYVVYLTVAYMIARGLAKSGSREVYDA